MNIYFETETECNEFRDNQKCRTMKFYDKITNSYYLMLSSKYDWLNREIKPNLDILDNSQNIYNNYCNIVKSIERCIRDKTLSQYEKENLPKLLKSFNKFRDSTRNSYDTDK